jgi:hypothetical protein
VLLSLLEKVACVVERFHILSLVRKDSRVSSKTAPPGLAFASSCEHNIVNRPSLDYLLEYTLFKTLGMPLTSDKVVDF